VFEKWQAEANLAPLYPPSPLTRIRLLGVMSAVRLHKMRTGSYPTTLEQLNLGEMSVDPFTGKPFIYRIDPRKGFLLYFIGPDGVDNGGAFGYGGFFENGDITPLYRPLPPNAPQSPPQARPLHPPIWLK